MSGTDPSLIGRWFDSGRRYWYADQSGNRVSLQLWPGLREHRQGRTGSPPQPPPALLSLCLSPSLSGSSLSSQLLLNF